MTWGLIRNFVSDSNPDNGPNHPNQLYRHSAHSSPNFGAKPVAFSLGEESLGKTKRIECAPSGDGDVFSSINGKSHWRALNFPAGLKVPEHMARSSIQ